MTPGGSARGAFIVLEGGEGSGKSTQARLLAARVLASGFEVVETFEPGGTPRGAALRAALLDDDTPLDAHAELLMMAADRAQHVAEVVAPALARGAVVVCDRFSPSTLAYQGVGRGIGVDVVDAIDALVVRDARPDVVIVLDVPDAVARARRPDARDRLERAGDEFHSVVRAAYRDLAAARGWIVVDGSAEPPAVAELVWSAVAPHLPGSRSI
ncbi:MAG TPA: dTMP kinase [Acidimicrobiia bacterium]|jgi:dTMP kinase|nr:dTMP kinase [Acidimicrobiia bacterium]